MLELSLQTLAANFSFRTSTKASFVFKSASRIRYKLSQWDQALMKAPGFFVYYFVAHSASSLVESKFSVTLLHCFFVCLLEIFGENNVPVLPYSLHTCFLANALDVSCRNLLWARDEVFEVYIIWKIHLAGQSLENEYLLASVRERELNLSIQSTRS